MFCSFGSEPCPPKRNGAALGLCGEPGIGSHGTHQLLRGLPCRSASVHATSSNSSILRGHDPVAALSSLEAAALAKDKELDLLERALAQSQNGPDLAMRTQITALLAEHANGTERLRLRLESVHLIWMRLLPA